MWWECAQSHATTKIPNPLGTCPEESEECTPLLELWVISPHGAPKVHLCTSPYCAKFYGDYVKKEGDLL